MPVKKTESVHVAESTNSKKSILSLTHILLILVILFQSWALYLLTGNSVPSFGDVSMDPLGIKRAVLEIEYDKVGWKANYDIMTRAQQLSVNDPQNPSNIANMKKYVESFSWTEQATTSTQPKPGTAPEFNSGSTVSFSPDTLKKILSDTVFEWDTTANIAVIEYSDMECPFCIRQYHATELGKKLAAQYGKEIKFAFKNNRGVNHPGTEAKAIGLLCAGKVGWNDAYIKFYKTVMDGSTTSGVYPVENLPLAAKSAGVDAKKWKKCFDAKDTLSAFKSQTEEAQWLGLGGTPGTIIVNLKTLQYMTVEWAYPYETFTQKIDALMKN